MSKYNLYYKACTKADIKDARATFIDNLIAIVAAVLFAGLVMLVW